MHGEEELSILNTSKTTELIGFLLVSGAVRKNSNQQECLRRAGVSNMKRKYHAVHYVGLNIAIQLNSMLPPEYRLSPEDLSRVFNLQCNLKAVPRSVNLEDHPKVDRFILLFITRGDLVEPKNVTRFQLRNIRDRLAEIAKKVPRVSRRPHAGWRTEVLLAHQAGIRTYRGVF